MHVRAILWEFATTCEPQFAPRRERRDRRATARRPHGAVVTDEKDDRSGPRPGRSKLIKDRALASALTIYWRIAPRRSSIVRQRRGRLGDHSGLDHCAKFPLPKQQGSRRRGQKARGSNWRAGGTRRRNAACARARRIPSSRSQRALPWSSCSSSASSSSTSFRRRTERRRKHRRTGSPRRAPASSASKKAAAIAAGKSISTTRPGSSATKRACRATRRRRRIWAAGCRSRKRATASMPSATRSGKNDRRALTQGPARSIVPPSSVRGKAAYRYGIRPDQFGRCFETPLKPHPEEAA